MAYSCLRSPITQLRKSVYETEGWWTIAYLHMLSKKASAILRRHLRSRECNGIVYPVRRGKAKLSGVSKPFRFTAKALDCRQTGPVDAMDGTLDGDSVFS